MDQFTNALTKQEPVIEQPKLIIDRVKLMDEIAQCEAQILRQQEEIDRIDLAADAQAEAVEQYVEAEAQKAADEKRVQLQDEWRGKVQAAKQGPENGIARCVEIIDKNTALLAEEGK
jgi:hypothetical protein